MDTFSLKCFIALAKTKSFSEAAKQNFVSQSTLSRTVKDLENSLGVVLCHRTNHSFNLTEEGEEFYKYALSSIEDEEKIRHRLQMMSQRSSGVIRIALLGGAIPFVYRCLKEFSSRYPDVQFMIDVLDGKEFYDSLSGHHYDFYYGTVNSFESTHNLDYFEAVDEHFVLAANKNIAEGINPYDIKSYSHLPFACISQEDCPIFYDIIMNFTNSMGYHPLIRSSFKSVESLMIAVNSGIGITITIEGCARMFKSEDTVIMNIRPDIVAMTIAIGWHRGSLSNTGVKFLEMLREIYTEKEHPVKTT